MRFFNSLVTCVALLCLAGAICAQPAATCAPNNVVETFDNAAPWPVGLSASGACAGAPPVFDPNWTVDAADTNCWQVLNQSTPSYLGNGVTTGDHTTGSGQFLYTEASPGGSPFARIR